MASFVEVKDDTEGLDERLRQHLKNYTERRKDEAPFNPELDKMRKLGKPYIIIPTYLEVTMNPRGFGSTNALDKPPAKVVQSMPVSSVPVSSVAKPLTNTLPTNTLPTNTLPTNTLPTNTGVIAVASSRRLNEYTEYSSEKLGEEIIKETQEIEELYMQRISLFASIQQGYHSFSQLPTVPLRDNASQIERNVSSKIALLNDTILRAPDADFVKDLDTVDSAICEKLSTISFLLGMFHGLNHRGNTPVLSRPPDYIYPSETLSGEEIMRGYMENTLMGDL